VCVRGCAGWKARCHATGRALARVCAALFRPFALLKQVRTCSLLPCPLSFPASVSFPGLAVQKALASKESSIKKDLEIVLGTQFDNSAVGSAKEVRDGRGGERQAKVGGGGSWDALWKHRKKKKQPALLGTDDEKKLVR
jgi:hypothetical protein